MIRYPQTQNRREIMSRMSRQMHYQRYSAAERKEQRKKLIIAYAKMLFWWFFLMFSYTIPGNLILCSINGDFSIFLSQTIAWTLIPGSIGLLVLFYLTKTAIDGVELTTRVWQRFNAIIIWHTLYRLFWKKDTILHLLD